MRIRRGANHRCGRGSKQFGQPVDMIGMVVGTLPGLTATMGTALLVPFTFALPTEAGIAMLGGLYVCAMFSDAIPAVLVNTPGTPAAMATAFDGHPMVHKGRGQEAIVAACFSSAIGTLFGAAAYLLLAWPLITIALKFGPPEFFWLGIFALTIIGSLAGDSILKGLAGGAIGLLHAGVDEHLTRSHVGALGQNDLHGTHDRAAALVLGMTPVWNRNWGGQLAFFDDAGNVEQAFAPAFNSLAIFLVPARHAVLPVAPFAGAPRTSYLSWLHRS